MIVLDFKLELAGDQTRRRLPGAARLNHDGEAFYLSPGTTSSSAGDQAIPVRLYPGVDGGAVLPLFQPQGTARDWYPLDLFPRTGIAAPWPGAPDDGWARRYNDINAEPDNRMLDWIPHRFPDGTPIIAQGKTNVDWMGPIKRPPGLPQTGPLNTRVWCGTENGLVIHTVAPDEGTPAGGEARQESPAAIHFWKFDMDDFARKGDAPKVVAPGTKYLGAFTGEFAKPRLNRCDVSICGTKYLVLDGDGVLRWLTVLPEIAQIGHFETKAIFAECAKGGDYDDGSVTFGVSWARDNLSVAVVCLHAPANRRDFTQARLLVVDAE